MQRVTAVNENVSKIFGTLVSLLKSNDVGMFDLSSSTTHWVFLWSTSLGSRFLYLLFFCLFVCNAIVFWEPQNSTHSSSMRASKTPGLICYLLPPAGIWWQHLSTSAGVGWCAFFLFYIWKKNGFFKVWRSLVNFQKIPKWLFQGMVYKVLKRTNALKTHEKY